MSTAVGERAWVFKTTSDETRSWAANQGYDDSTGIYYSYDSNVGRCRQVEVGDLIVIREDSYVAGWAFVEHIEITENSPKEIARCPNCHRTDFYPRKTISPANKCNNCKYEFHHHETVTTTEFVTAYRAFYANSWEEASRPVTVTELESIIKTPDPINSIRPLEMSKVMPFLETISGRDVDLVVDIGEQEVAIILGGHTEATVRRRRGQREFRFKMIEKFGEICAFSGGQPPQVLEAAHINSFAQTGEHHLNGGLLLRRDFHALFDANLMTVNPRSWEIEIAPRLQRFETYRPLNGGTLHIPASERPNTLLLESHYEQSMRIFEHN
jgi:predicted nucleic-acid-binding Zn-ribbon protein